MLASTRSAPKREWPPLLAAVESLPGTFRLLEALGRKYGAAELRRVGGGEVSYRVAFRADHIAWRTRLA